MPVDEGPGPVSVSQLVWAANRTLDMHWSHKDEKGQPRRCVACTDDGCPQLEWAQLFLLEYNWT